MAIRSITCGNCGAGVAAEVIYSIDVYGGTIVWLQCPGCLDGSVKTLSGAIYPVAPTGRTVANLPPEVAQAWREARTAHAVAAYTASEIMCRKILMHLAVDVAQSPVGGTFKQYVEALDTAGYISAGLRPAVEKIKDRGNAANHDLPASNEEGSRSTLKITEHLLAGIYEIPGL